MKHKFFPNEFLHYVVGTFLIIFGGHWFSGVIGLEQWAINNNFIGMVVLFIYYLVVYIIIDQTLHKIFKVK